MGEALEDLLKSKGPNLITNKSNGNQKRKKNAGEK